MIPYILKLAVSLGLFAWLIWSGEIRFESFRQLAQHKSYLAGVVGHPGGSLPAGGASLAHAGAGVSDGRPIPQDLKFFLMGEFFSLFFLGALGGDLSRMIFLGAHDPRHKAGAAVTVILDKAIALWVLCGIGFAALWGYQPLSGAERWVATVKTVLALPLLGVPLALVLLHGLPRVVAVVASKTGQSGVLADAAGTPVPPARFRSMQELRCSICWLRHW